MQSPLVQATGLSVSFGALRAVDGVSLDIAAGESVGLIGESGCGKTTLGKALLGLVRPAAGRVSFEGQDVPASTRAGRLRLARRAQLLPQDPVSALSPRLTVRALLAEPARIHGLPSREAWAHVEALMGELNLPATVLDRYPHQISGGQARRVGIARALALKPAFVMADEPTAGLDLSLQGDLLNLLMDLRAKAGLTYLLVSHNLDVVARITDRLAIMYLGQIVETGATRTVYTRPAHPYTAALLSARPRIDPARRAARIVLSGDVPSPISPPPGCRFHTRCPQAQARCRAESPHLGGLPGIEGRAVRCHFPLG